MLTLDRKTTTTALVLEALTDLFTKKPKHDGIIIGSRAMAELLYLNAVQQRGGCGGYYKNAGPNVLAVALRP